MTVRDLWCAMVLLLTTALPVSAQKTQRVFINITGVSDACPGPSGQPTYVVLNGDENNQFKVACEGNRCWGTWIGARPLDRFRIKGAYASLRYGKTRTGCSDAEPEDDPKFDDPWAWFKFVCNTHPTRNVELSTFPPGVELGYTRTLPGKDRCVENGIYNSAIQNVRFGPELLRVRVGAESSEDQAPGVLVNLSLIVRDPAKGAEKTLTRNDVLYKLAVSRATGNPSPDALSANAIDVDIFRVNRIKLESITVTAK